jgi:LCP family protein required for cell wall assembly
MTNPNETSRRALREAKAAVPPVRHGRGRRFIGRRSVRSVIGLALSVALVSVGSVAAIAAWDIYASGNTVDLAGLPAIGAIEGGFNVLLVGSDTRKGQSNNFGADPGSTLNDVNMLLHVSADHKNATVVSIPRDMVVHIPECPGGGGGWSGPINATLNDGGLACVVLTVEELTGMKIPYAALVTFDGVSDLSNVVGGVQVCVATEISDPFTDLYLKPGLHTLKGLDALQYLRTRHGVGDGSDLGRISNQQSFLSALVRKVKDENMLANPVMIYGIGKSVVSNMTLSKSLASADTIVSMAMAFKDIDINKITFVQYPGSTGGTGIYAGKVEPSVDAADELFAALMADKPITITGGLGRAAEAAPTPTATPTPGASGSATPTPTPTPSASAAATSTPTPTAVALPQNISGQTADELTCAKGN